MLRVHGVGASLKYDPDDPSSILYDILNIGLGVGEQRLRDEIGLNPGVAPVVPAGNQTQSSGLPTWLIPAAIGLAAVVLLKRK